MIHIIPAAGPDFIDENGNIKFDRNVNNKSLISQTILKRTWRAKNDNYIFVFQDSNITREYSKKLENHLPRVNSVFLPKRTNGAADTVLAALSVAVPNMRICIDLADIIIEDKIERTSIINSLTCNEALCLTFESYDERYSYLEFDGKSFIRAKEKIVISNNASAGVYFFKNKNFLLSAMSKVLDNKEYQYNGLNFICPLFNGLTCVDKLAVKNVFDIK